MGGKASDLIVRTLSGVVLLAVVLGSAVYSYWTFAGLVALLLIGCLYEFYKICRRCGLRPQSGCGLALGIVILGLNMLVAAGIISSGWLGLLAPLPAVVLAGELYRKNANPIAEAGATVLGLVYIALPLSLLLHLSVIGGEYLYRIPLGIIFIVWANDIGAYLSGVAFGRHKLFERISPKKSWEGFIGGVVCAVALASIMGSHMGFSPWFRGIGGLVIAISAVFGDLVESLFKRSAGVKDSGSVIPGHGGMLDRFDALLVAIPFVFAYFIIFTA